jgi:anti-sigma regulatory factor (Ser/Thr protein kinase)
VTEARTQFELTIWTDLNLVSVVRRFIEETYERAWVAAEDISRIALAAHELLENAVKYSVGGRINIEIAMDSSEGRERVWICVRNRSCEANLSALRQAFTEIEQTTEPAVYYQSLMRRNAKRREVSGLGLARILVEGDMKLSFEYEADLVCLRAQGALEKRRMS